MPIQTYTSNIRGAAKSKEKCGCWGSNSAATSPFLPRESPVNSLGFELRRCIVEALARAEDDPPVKAMVIIGSGKGFSGRRRHPRIRHAQGPRSTPACTRYCAPSRTARKPVIAAIGGHLHGRGPGAGARLPLPRRRPGRAARPARGEARPAARRRRHATPAACDRRRACPEHDRLGQPGARRGAARHGALGWHRRGRPAQAALEFARALVAGSRGPKRCGTCRSAMPERRGLPAVRPHHREGGRPAPIRRPPACVEACWRRSRSPSKRA